MSRIKIGKVALNPKGNWVSTTTYEKLDMVISGGKTFVARDNVPVGTTTSTTTYWQQMVNSFESVTTTTVSASTGASASIIGTPDKPILSLQIPRGVSGNESIDDTAGDGDTDKVWSADKSYDVVGKTTGYKKETISIGGNGYIDASLIVRSTSTKWRYSEPIAVEKGKHYLFTAETASVVSAITKAQADGTLIETVTMGTSDPSIAWTSEFDGYVVLSFNSNSSYSLLSYYQTKDAVVLIPDVNNLSKNVSEISIIVNNETETINLSSMTFETAGYVGGNGDFYAPTSTSHKIVKMDASHLRYLAFKTSTAWTDSVAFGVLKNSGGSKVKTFPFDNTTNWQIFELEPNSGDVLYVSWFNFATTPNPYYDSFKVKNYDGIPESYKKEIVDVVRVAAEVKYHTCAKKPFNFNNKSCYFFGDSITYGYIAASGNVPAHQATNQYPKVFSEAVGATYTNYGVSGATLCEVDGYASIFTKIQTETLDSDYLFISGGVNDWQLGVNEATLESGVEDICDYLDANYTGEVIFITPINEVGRVPIVTPTQTIQNVRNVITRIALKHGYSVVQGWEFPFPTTSDDATYISQMFQDKLHPTELGYAMYAQALRNAVC